MQQKKTCEKNNIKYSNRLLKVNCYRCTTNNIITLVMIKIINPTGNHSNHYDMRHRYETDISALSDRGTLR